MTERIVNGWNRMQLITTACPFHLQGWSPDAEHSARLKHGESQEYFRSDWRDPAVGDVFEIATLSSRHFFNFASPNCILESAKCPFRADSAASPNTRASGWGFR
jgi:hypothetical protein